MSTAYSLDRAEAFPYNSGDETFQKRVTGMPAALTPSQVHRQYNEAVTAFRRLIPDPALRMAFWK